MHNYDTTLIPIEDVLKQQLKDHGYAQSSASGVAWFKTDELVSKYASYHTYADQVVLTHETRLLRTGSRVISVRRVRNTDSVPSVVSQLDDTVVKY